MSVCVWICGRHFQVRIESCIVKPTSCPYYIPDDFAYISFEYNVPDQDIQQWDTITVSGSEIYTIISASYRNDTSTGRTIGIAFCGRTV